MALRITSDDLNRLAEHLSNPEPWVTHFVDANMRQLGSRIAYLMRMQLKPHHYTGALEDSVQYEYDPKLIRLKIGPTAKRGGKWDAGMLLERGTGPIRNLPFAPIARWAAFKGIPAGPVWYSIKTKGVKAHPWIDSVIARGDFQVAVGNTAKRIGMDLASEALQILPTKNGRALRFTGSSQQVFPGANHG